MCNISFIKELTEAILAIVGLISLLIPFLKKIVIPSWYFIIKILPYKIRLKWKFNEILKTQGIGTIKCIHCNSKNIRLNTKERIKEGTIIVRNHLKWMWVMFLKCMIKNGLNIVNS